MQFHDRVKFLLNKERITQQKFAEMLDISSARLNNYLTGKTEAGYELLGKIALLLNTSTDYLLGNQIGYLCERSAIPEGKIYSATINGRRHDLSGAAVIDFDVD